MTGKEKQAERWSPLTLWQLEGSQARALHRAWARKWEKRTERSGSPPHEKTSTLTLYHSLLAVRSASPEWPRTSAKHHDVVIDCHCLLVSEQLCLLQSLCLALLSNFWKIPPFSGRSSLFYRRSWDTSCILSHTDSLLFCEHTKAWRKWRSFWNHL